VDTAVRTRPATVAAAPATVAGRAPLLSVAVLAVGAVVAAWARTALAWDGSYFLFSLLHRQEPFLLHARVSTAVLQWPVVGASRLTDDLGVLASLFTLLFALVPALALALCWVVVRDRRPDLFVWGAIGIGLVTLPGQVFFVSESLMAAQLSWPVVLWVLGGNPRRHLPLVAMLVLLIVFLHPVSTGFLVGAAVLLAGLAVLERGDRAWRAGAAAVLLLAAGLRLVLLGGSRYEGEAFAPMWFAIWFVRAVRGLPLLALVAALGLGVAVVLLRRRKWPTLLLVAGGALGAAGCALLVWALEGRWDDALDYRVWGALLTVPFMVLAAVDSRIRPKAGGAPAAATQGLPVLCALVFTLVVTVQSLQWRDQLAAFAAEVAALPVPCAEHVSLASVPGTPLRHWGVRALSVLVQDRDPQRVVMGDGEGCTGVVEGRALPLSPHDLSDRAGWFDLRAVSAGG